MRCCSITVRAMTPTMVVVKPRIVIPRSSIQRGSAAGSLLAKVEDVPRRAGQQDPMAAPPPVM